ncbi:MAG: peptidoglycan-binding domain-containing protein [Blastocatellia bacterium]|nr:peptidoglycan-binding domain-containing protein [Blastocatellia bacterium]
MTAEPTQFELEEMLEALRSAKSRGQSKREMRRLLRSGVEHDLCKRAALLRSFDRGIYEGLLAAEQSGETAPPFEEFVAQSGIEPVPRTEGVHRLKESARREHLSAWIEEEREAATSRQRLLDVQTWLRDDLSDEEDAPETRREFALRALAFYRKRGDVSDLDRLSLTILANPVEAGKTFGKLYKQADERFDLPRCHSLLQIMEDRFQDLPAEEQARVLRQRQQYNARSLFTYEFYRTTTYYHRESILKQLQPLLKPTTGAAAKWIFQLFATGGMGKTTFLRFLIARHCVPDGIPVARLDCDELNLPIIGRYPWLALLPLAQQLNEQIEGRPFNELIGELEEFAPAIRRPLSPEHEATEARRQATQKLEKSDDYWAVNARLRFRDKLTHVAGGQQPVLFILDTLEEMALIQPANLMALLETIDFLHAERPELRLILSGRYDLLAHIPAFAARFAGATDSLRLAPFTEKESLAYLKKKRGLSEKLPLRAIHARSGGNPFKLSLFAELASSRESLTEDEVARLPNAEFAYLIERIVDRIQEADLRWVLRYGVIPRQLTREFMEEVMGPHLLREMGRLASESGQLDRGNESLPEIYRERNIFPQVSTERLDFDLLWNQLKQYASSYGWMSIDPATDEPRFHPETIVPMRQLLEAEAIFPALHADAAVWFEKKAAEAAADPARWARSLCEAIYHRFQQSAAEGAAFWTRAIDEDAPWRDPAIRKRLAQEITGRDYVDDEGAPLKHKDGGPLIDPETLRQAHRVAAEAAIALAWESGQRRREWEDAQRHLAALERLGGLTAQWIDLKRAADLLAMDERPQALAALQNIEIEDLEEQAGLSLLVQMGDLSKLRKTAETVRFYQKARRHLAKMPNPHIPARVIRRKLGDWFFVEKRYEEAIEQFGVIHEDAVRDNDATTAHEAALRLIEIDLEIGRYQAAEGLAASAAGLAAAMPSDATMRRSLLHARALLEMLDPAAALQQLDKIHLSKDPRNLALLAELRGAARGALMQFNEALDELETAKNLWHEAGAEMEADRCRLQIMKIHLHGRSGVNDAYYKVSEWLRRTNREASEIELAMILMQIHLDVRAGRTEAARHQWNKAREAPEINRWPRWMATFTAAGLALGLTGSGENRPEEIDPALLTLAEQLQQIEPFSLRLLAIEPLQWAATSPPVSDNARARVRAALGKLAVPEEVFPHALRLADVARYLGDDDAGATLLRAAFRRATPPSGAFDEPDAFRYFETLKAANRWGARLKDLQAPIPSTTLYENDLARRALCIAVLQAQAERAIHKEEIEIALEHLTAAEEKENDASDLSWFRPVNAGLTAQRHELTGRALLCLEKPLQAAGLFATAKDLYAGLGDQQSARRIETLLAQAGSVATRGALPATAPPQPQPQTQPAVIRTRFIQLETDANPEPAAPLRVTYTDPNLPLHLRRANNTRTLADGLTRLLHPDPGSSSNVSRELLDFLLKDPVEAGLALGRILFTREQTAELLAAPPLDLTLSLPFGPLSRVPWELVRLNADREEVPLVRRHSLSRTSPTFPASADAKRWIQQTANLLLKTKIPVDGLYGPQTEHVVGELQRLFGPEIDGDLGRGTKEALRNARRKAAAAAEPLRAWVLRPSEKTRVRSQRGAGESFVENFYTQRTSNIVFWLEDPDVDAMRSDLSDASHWFDIIHVVTSFSEDSRSGEIHLDFGVTRTATKTAQSSRGASRITASQFNQALTQMSADRVRPLVILDVILPSDPYEAARQLVLRNDFAASLFELGNVSGVIGLGPASEQDMQLARARLVTSLLRGESYSAAVAESRGEPHTSPLLPTFFSTALFTTDSSLSLIAAI